MIQINCPHCGEVLDDSGDCINCGYCEMLDNETDDDEIEDY